MTFDCAPVVFIASAFVLDLFLGDPAYSLHPVRVIGAMIARLEGPFRRLSDNLKLNGLVFALTIISITLLAAITPLTLLYCFDDKWVIQFFFAATSIYFIYSGLALRDLAIKATAVATDIENKHFDRARIKMSYLVGRDTACLDEHGLIRAAVETVAENISDGIIAPLVFAFTGGAVGIMTYKAINTLDSMIGYKNERYREFGWAAARIDDIANFIPARLSVIAIALAAMTCGQDPIRVIKIAWRDGAKNPSPNAGWPEAAVAAALGVLLGGTNYYEGRQSKKPLIGLDRYPLGAVHIRGAVRLAYGAAVSVLITGTLFKIFLIGIL